MSPESIVYARLSTDAPLTALVGDRINPTQPPVNELLAYMTYTVTAGESGVYLSGQPSTLHRYTVSIDAYAKDMSPVLDVLAAIKDRLNGWRAIPVQYCRWDGDSTSKEETGHHGTASYTLWVTQS